MPTTTETPQMQTAYLFELAAVTGSIRFGGDFVLSRTSRFSSAALVGAFNRLRLENCVHGIAVRARWSPNLTRRLTPTTIEPFTRQTCPDRSESRNTRLNSTKTKLES